MYIKPIAEVKQGLKGLRLALKVSGIPFKDYALVIDSSTQLLDELKERRGQICHRCRYYEQGCCVNPGGLLGAKGADHCSRWAPKPLHEKED